MDFGLTSAFNNAVNRYGLSAALVGVSLLVIIFLLMKFAMARIESGKLETAALIRSKEESEKIANQERSGLLEEVRAARQQNQTIVENHLAHDAADRLEMVKAMAAIQAREEVTVQALRELSTSIAATREESAKRSAQLHERLNQIHIAVVSKGA